MKGNVSEEPGSLQKQKVEPLDLEGEDIKISKGVVRQSVDSDIAEKWRNLSTLLSSTNWNHLFVPKSLNVSEEEVKTSMFYVIL